MKCSNCGNELTPEMFSSRMCFTCGQSTSDSEKAFNEEQNKLREEQKKESDRQKQEIQKQCAEHLLTTGYDFKGYTITKYHGLVSGECVVGSGLISYLEASITNTFGIETTGYSEKMKIAKQLALDEMIKQSVSMGGNSIIGISYSISNLLSNMIGISVDGTSVTTERETTSQEE